MKNDFKILYGLFAFSLIIIFSGFKAYQNAFPEQLDWDTHFRGEPDEYSAYAALTATTWHYSYNSTIKGNRLNIDFKFAAGVDPSNLGLNAIESEIKK